MAKKKEIKKLEFPEHYYVLGADLSLKRPGFCLLSVDKAQGSPIIKVKKLVSLDNKTDHKKSHGQLLEEIRHFFIKSFFPLPDAVYAVRETEIMKVKVPSERSSVSQSIIQSFQRTPFSLGLKSRLFASS